MFAAASMTAILTPASLRTRFSTLRSREARPASAFPGLMVARTSRFALTFLATVLTIKALRTRLLTVLSNPAWGTPATTSGRITPRIWMSTLTGLGAFVAIETRFTGVLTLRARVTRRTITAAGEAITPDLTITAGLTPAGIDASLAPTCRWACEFADLAVPALGTVAAPVHGIARTTTQAETSLSTALTPVARGTGVSATGSRSAGRTLALTGHLVALDAGNVGGTVTLVFAIFAVGAVRTGSRAIHARPTNSRFSNNFVGELIVMSKSAIRHLRCRINHSTSP
uniref:Uncharacterized protein n=1 Tax=Schistocephalus solidus TaxID=70667 RepID=A0A0X3NNR9_SCHSO